MIFLALPHIGQYLHGVALNTENFDMNFPELLTLCLNVNLDISDEQTKQVEKDTRSQVKGSGHPSVVFSFCQSEVNFFYEIAVCQPVWVNISKLE